MRVELRGIEKRFQEFTALSGIGLDIEAGHLCALLGPSGSGKTTLLRIIAGLEHADAGSLRIGGTDMSAIDVRDRQVGFVFQHYALFRHMSVLDNIGFGLKVRPRQTRPEAEAIRARARELLALVQLEKFGDRYPDQLSGGQRQRVALARALAIEPRILLLDEPFGALDARVRKDLRRWLRELHQTLKLTTVFVTHDQEEALELADQVVVMDHGRVEQIGSPSEVYERPATPFVYEFLGQAVRLPCRIGPDRVDVEGAVLPRPAGYAGPDGAGEIFVRPHDLVPQEARSDAFPIAIRSVNVVGPLVRVEAVTQHGAIPIDLEWHRRQLAARLPAAGETLQVGASHFGLFPARQAA